MNKIKLQEIEDLIKKESFENHYDVEHELGRGRFAVVKRCVCRETGKRYAAKLVKKSRTNSHGRSGREQLLMEIDILNKSTHPKMVRLYNVFETRSEMQLILEYAEGGDLHRHCIESDVTRTEKEICYLIRQILEAVRYLHNEKIVHLDLKPDNILLAKKAEVFPEIRLIDFGLSRSLEGPYSQFDIVGTAEYVAPEVLAFEPIDFGSDMWSIGVVTYVLLSGISPFAGDDVMETYANIGMVDFDFDCEEFDEISDNAIDFIEKLLVRNPKKRMTSREALEHDWVKQLEGGLSTGDVIQAQRARRETLPTDLTISALPQEEFASSSGSESPSSALEDENEIPVGEIKSEIESEVKVEYTPSDGEVQDDEIITSKGNENSEEKVSTVSTTDDEKINANVVTPLEDDALSQDAHTTEPSSLHEVHTVETPVTINETSSQEEAHSADKDSFQEEVHNLEETSAKELLSISKSRAPEEVKNIQASKFIEGNNVSKGVSLKKDENSKNITNAKLMPKQNKVSQRVDRFSTLQTSKVFNVEKKPFLPSKRSPLPRENNKVNTANSLKNKIEDSNKSSAINFSKSSLKDSLQRENEKNTKYSSNANADQDSNSKENSNSNGMNSVILEESTSKEPISSKSTISKVSLEEINATSSPESNTESSLHVKTESKESVNSLEDTSQNIDKTEVKKDAENISEISNETDVQKKAENTSELTNNTGDKNIPEINSQIISETEVQNGSQNNDKVAIQKDTENSSLITDKLEIRADSEAPIYKKKSPVPIPAKKIPDGGSPKQHQRSVRGLAPGGIAAKMAKFSNHADSSRRPPLISKFEKRPSMEKKEMDAQLQKLNDPPVKRSSNEAISSPDIDLDKNKEKSADIKIDSNHDTHIPIADSLSVNGSLGDSLKATENSFSEKDVSSFNHTSPDAKSNVDETSRLNDEANLKPLPCEDEKIHKPKVGPPVLAKTKHPPQNKLVLNNLPINQVSNKKPPPVSPKSKPSKRLSDLPEKVLKNEGDSSDISDLTRNQQAEQEINDTKPAVSELESKSMEPEFIETNLNKDESKLSEMESVMTLSTTNDEEENSGVKDNQSDLGVKSSSPIDIERSQTPKNTLGSELKFSLTLGGTSPSGRKLNIGPLVSVANREKPMERSGSIPKQHEPTQQNDENGTEIEKESKSELGEQGTVDSLKHNSQNKDLRGKNDTVNRRRTGNEESSHRKTYRRLYVTKVRNSKLYEHDFDINTEAAKIVQRVDKDVLQVEVKLKSTDLKLLP